MLLAVCVAAFSPGWLKTVIGAAAALCAVGLGSYWFLLPYFSRRIPFALAPPAGFELIDLLQSESNGQHSVRVRLRPKGCISKINLRIDYDAPLSLVKWGVEGNRTGRLSSLVAELDEREIDAMSSASRSVEIPYNGPPSLTAETDFIIDLFGPSRLRVKKITASD